MGAYFSRLFQAVRKNPFLSGVTFSLLLLLRIPNSRKIKGAEKIVAYSAFLKSLQAGKIIKVLFSHNSVQGNGAYKFWTKDLPDAVQHTIPITESNVGAGLVKVMQKQEVNFSVGSPPLKSKLLPVLVASLPFAYLLAMGGLFYKIYKDTVGDVGEETGAHNSSSGDGHIPRVTFKDVAGIDEAKARVVEVVDFIKHPEKYERLGAQLSKGILLVGPPGTGKTLLARCIASEANVPFFYCSGSDFVEVYAGRGASRVRSLWKRVRKSSPSLLFIDELDALGGARGQGFSGNEEREQTLNQLLTCMDGFDTKNSGVVVIGATNRFQMLDRALCRPGRFDRIIKVPLPNFSGRKEVLKVHLKNKPCLTTRLNFDVLARETNSFSGAELAHVANEAAIAATLCDASGIEQRHIELAIAQYKNSRAMPEENSNEQAEFDLHDMLRHLSRTANS
jgi:cell division protease FtsH